VSATTRHFGKLGVLVAVPLMAKSVTVQHAKDKGPGRCS
jgi:hypothetical protein